MGWYVVQVGRGEMRSTRETCERYGVTVPLQRVKIHGREVEEPILYEYGFLNGEPSKRAGLPPQIRVLSEFPLSPGEVDWLYRLLRSGETGVRDEALPPSVGSRVRITSGVLSGYDGKVAASRGNRYGYRVMIDGLEAYVPVTALEPT